MSVKNVGQNVWKVSVSKRVKWSPFPIKRKATVRGLKTDAKLKEAELLRELTEPKDSSSLTAAASVTTSTYNVVNFGDAVDLYTEKLKAEGKLSESTATKYEWIKNQLGHVPIEGIGEAVDGWRRNFMKTPTVKGTLRMPGTINRPVASVRAVCNYLVDLEILPKNPITKIRFPKLKETPRAVYLSDEERERLFDVITNGRYSYLLPIVQYLMIVPCRIGELMYAKKEQLQGDTIFIPHSKNGESIYKPVPPSMVAYFNNIPEDCPYLFYRKMPRGYYRPLSNIQKTWIKVRELAGLPNLHLHDLRHISCTDMADGGCPERIIMGVAGWKTNMLNIYYHRQGKKSAQTVNKWLQQGQQGALKMAS